MTYYSPTSESLVSGTAWDNPSYARDSNQSTAAYRLKTNSTTQSEKWLGFPSVSLSGTFGIEIDWYAALASYEIAHDYLTSYATLHYSWDGTTWTDLTIEQSPTDSDAWVYYGPHGVGSGYQTFTISGTGRNLNTLQVKATIVGPQYTLGEISIYEIRANVSDAAPSASGKKILRCRPT